MRPPSGTFFNRVIVDVPFRLGVRVLNDARLPMRKFISPEIIFGSGSIELVGQHASNLSPRRVLVVSDAGVREAGWTGPVEASLRNSGLDLSTYDHASANPCVEDVVRGARRYLDDACDLVVAVGGGSPIDCAKAIGIMAAAGWMSGGSRGWTVFAYQVRLSYACLPRQGPLQTCRPSPSSPTGREGRR